MDKDLFRGQPFHAAGETEPAGHTGQRAELIAEERPLTAFGGQTVVVMRFAVVDPHAFADALFQRVIQIPADIAAGIILEQLGVGELHPSLCQERFRCFPGTAQTFQQEECLRELAVDS